MKTTLHLVHKITRHAIFYPQAGSLLLTLHFSHNLGVAALSRWAIKTTNVVGAQEKLLILMQTTARLD